MESEPTMDGEDGSYFVISDTHLGANIEGSDAPNLDALCKFLEWIKNLSETEKIIVQGSNYENGNDFKEIIPPSKIILLGDILELWDSQNGDRSNVIKQAAKPFTLLTNIKCDKIYVVGNHDQDLYELADILSKEDKGKAGYLDLGSHALEVHKKHYPKKVNYGVNIGGKKYAFLHGHQYDKIQITDWISKKFGIRFDPLDVVQDICNISWVKSILRKEKKPVIAYIVSVLAILLIPYMSLGEIGRILIIVLLTFAIIPPLVWIITRSQRKFWKLVKPKDKTVKEVIRNGSYYKENDDKMENIDVVVFGHTHLADSYFFEEKKRLFVNTGAWVKVQNNDQDSTRYENTFAYIDNKGISVLSWTGEESNSMYIFKEVCHYSS